jgi:hypothetical protein
MSKKRKQRQRDRKKRQQQFYRWLTDWEDYCLADPASASKITEAKFWPWRSEQLRIAGSTSPRTKVDQMWLTAGKPYYNIHSKLAPKFCKVNLNKIPSNTVETPFGISCVNMRFDQQHDGLTMKAAEGSSRQDQWWNHGEGVSKGAWVRSFMLMRPTTEILRLCFRGTIMLGSQEQVLMLYIDTGSKTKYGVHIHMAAPLICRNGVSLNDAIQECCDYSIDAGSAFQEVVANCCRIAVTVGFLANADDSMIDPDIIPRLKDRYANAKPNERPKIIAESQRLGGSGFNVGNDIMFLGTQPVQGRRQSEKTGRELQYQHLRDGHPHAVRYGPKRSLVKIMWIRPTRVRPDLPFKSD